MVKYQYGIYKKQPLYFSELKLSEIQRFKLIDYFEAEAYGNTDQNTEEYAFEFLIVVRNLCNSHLVVNPVFLLIEDCFDELKPLLADQWKIYYKDYCNFKNL